ncbi:uncharacterized protein B0T15DRAFT_49940 [Chaetomium strumarium]|uniref:Zinc finger PHD-type domain-containing protein n=1 Tax=Chaetomium strumarium TaxID=1170767 RepID=A0AAJ0M6N5_9PEZI|nr:hypothetical protein B0T15DRAFT_49940 [Chaetomium strumarium]
MAGADPRRSSRARATQSQSQISSTASSVSGRLERSSRHFNKGGSPQKSTSTGSLSSEPPEDTITAEDLVTTRRRTRGQAEERDRTAPKAQAIAMTNGDGDVQEEDEAVRCVCGNDEYQGPPPLDEDSKHGFKHGFDLDSFFSADVTDDTAGLFVQCDICKVWQHGGCVGIMTEESSPDEYFCEQCRADLHKLWTASNGSVFSHYLPLKRNARTTSRAASLNKDTARSPTKEKDSRNGRASSSNQTSKRRSTLNSREAGYDEAEALRRAIEASKEDALPEQLENGSRRPKRGRSDSQEKPENVKRHKTSSRSSSPLSDKNAEDSDEADATGRNGASKSKLRSRAASRTQRVEKASEKEERERLRTEAASKRKGRAERRRADDSDPSEEMPLAARAAANRTAQAAGGPNATGITTTEAVGPAAAGEPPATSNPAPDTPPTVPVQAKVDKKRSHKKKGRNQYTRDRDAHEDDSPGRSQSRDIQRDDHGPPSGGKAAGEGHGKANSRQKGGMSSKITMNDMKRRAAALLDFISRTQVELAGESFAGTTAGTTNSANDTPLGTSEKAEDGVDPPPALVSGEDGQPRSEKDFKELGCMEMMDTLTRRLVKWQQQYAT